ncbi:type II toxin-antitoxin system VapC family toxin, partial [Citrobacter amalonaticus]
MKKTWMLDTNICSFIMREQPAAVLKRLEQAVLRGDRIVVSAVTYAEMRFGATGPKASPRHIQLVDAFCARLDAVLPWDRAAVDATTDIRVALRLAGRGQFGYRKLLYYKGFPGVSTPVFMVSVCSSVKIKGRDCGTING